MTTAVDSSTPSLRPSGSRPTRSLLSRITGTTAEMLLASRRELLLGVARKADPEVAAHPEHESA